MTKITDVTGVIQDGMWNYDPPFPRVSIRPLPKVPWLTNRVYCELFEGMHSQTGTYLETPAHFYGNNDPRTYLLIDVPVEKLYNSPCVVLNVGLLDKSASSQQHGISVQELESCENAKDIQAGDAILVGTGWGRYWMDKDYLSAGPYFTRSAMEWLIAKKPTMIGGDFARWENMETPQGFFPSFYSSDILMVGPLVNLEKISSNRCKIIALPLKVADTSCAPARVLIIEDNE